MKKRIWYRWADKNLTGILENLSVQDQRHLVEMWNYRYGVKISLGTLPFVNRMSMSNALLGAPLWVLDQPELDRLALILRGPDKVYEKKSKKKAKARLVSSSDTEHG